jgi:hypothetical protein
MNTLCLFFCLVPLFYSLTIRNVRVEEEKVRGECGGFVWELLFDVDTDAANASFYAQYWPDPASLKSPNVGALEPYSSYACIVRGGVQKLQSKVHTVLTGITKRGYISLFRYDSSRE